MKTDDGEDRVPSPDPAVPTPSDGMGEEQQQGGRYAGGAFPSRWTENEGEGREIGGIPGERGRVLGQH